MANGKLFDQGRSTVASRSLPFGTVVRIQIGNRSATGIVTDRGPYTGGRILDVSKGMAKTLGLIKAGVATGSVTVISSPSPNKKSKNK